MKAHTFMIPNGKPHIPWGVGVGWVGGAGGWHGRIEKKGKGGLIFKLIVSKEK